MESADYTEQVQWIFADLEDLIDGSYDTKQGE